MHCDGIYLAFRLRIWHILRRLQNHEYNACTVFLPLGETRIIVVAHRIRNHLIDSLKSTWVYAKNVDVQKLIECLVSWAKVYSACAISRIILYYVPMRMEIEHSQSAGKGSQMRLNGAEVK